MNIWRPEWVLESLWEWLSKTGVICLSYCSLHVTTDYLSLDAIQTVITMCLPGVTTICSNSFLFLQLVGATQTTHLGLAAIQTRVSASVCRV